MKLSNGRWLINGLTYTETFGLTKQIFEEGLRAQKTLEVGKMNIQKQIQFWKRQKQIAADAKRVARQNYEVAARLESEANVALGELVAKPGQPQKGVVLSEARKLALVSSITRKAGHA